ncbi:DUF4267 domain-containing protein [Sporichthya polymorpha]|uniref:DUF4267 domain-containing protein n=1 Tax=Sporichthya polymorpha TaxID=35751 RepID=UPI0003693BA9|nr:DUF4267 domain-containing protein [Sporichthya polymorpha]
MAFPIPLTIAATRIGAGILTYAAPETAAKMFGIRDAENSSAYLARLFGSRDLVLGLALLSGNSAVRRNTLRLGLIVDSCDAVAGLIETKRGKLTPVGSAVLVGGAVAFAALGYTALRDAD